MTTLLIPDSGPLFSLAVGGLLDLLTHFKGTYSAPPRLRLQVSVARG